MDEETGLAADPENNELFIVGGAVIEIAPESEYHTVDAYLTMTSPQGRTVTNSGTWTQKSEGTSITVTTPIIMVWDPEPDTGNYESNLMIVPTCPDHHHTTTGGDSFPLGVTYIAMQIVMPPNHNGYGYLYEKVQPCDVYCNAPQTNRYPGGPAACIQLQIPYGPLGCSFFVRVRKGVTSCICFDVGWN